MIQDALIPRRGAARLLFGPLAALCLTPSAVASIDADPQEKVAAAKVAKKVEKARSKKHQDKEQAEALRHFKKELAEYATLHDKLVLRIGGADTASAQQALAAALTTSRAKAKPGDIFVRDVQPLIRQLVADQLSGPDTFAARKAVAEGNPGHEEDSIPVMVRVNAPYPTGASRSTVPASVLLTLPTLPACLHYRFVDRDLILVDAVAQLIVDFITGVAPQLPVK